MMSLRGRNRSGQLSRKCKQRKSEIQEELVVVARKITAR
jgi:hypothetical protein